MYFAYVCVPVEGLRGLCGDNIAYMMGTQVLAVDASKDESHKQQGVPRAPAQGFGFRISGIGFGLPLGLLGYNEGLGFRAWSRIGDDTQTTDGLKIG